MLRRDASDHMKENGHKVNMVNGCDSEDADDGAGDDAIEVLVVSDGIHDVSDVVGEVDNEKSHMDTKEVRGGSHGETKPSSVLERRQERHSEVRPGWWNDYETKM
ncbi:hypothetical protein NDU88_002715 [Pleurodeles waltl]|uniref:Uncharacterized protein n=1 Tax=Pleurodeles waltl TaxID=8319 RepID=A0AAV7PAT7_PLEWA|nr:hypothetical protein NDU88_002715 [Pleurodeles waltl]